MVQKSIPFRKLGTNTYFLRHTILSREIDSYLFTDTMVTQIRLLR
jgi:hypothetical protein